MEDGTDVTFSRQCAPIQWAKDVKQRGQQGEEEQNKQKRKRKVRSTDTFFQSEDSLLRIREKRTQDQLTNRSKTRLVFSYRGPVPWKHCLHASLHSSCGLKMEKVYFSKLKLVQQLLFGVWNSDRYRFIRFIQTNMPEIIKYCLESWITC